MKNVLLTGVTGGIGGALFEKFAANDFFVVGIYGKNEEKANALRSRGFPCALFSCDFSDVKNATALGKKLVAEYGAFDCVVHCAGVSHVSVLQEETDEKLQNILSVNLLSPIALTREVIPAMISAKKGAILNISSVWGNYGGSCEVAYSATKGGLNAFTKALARELGASNIRVNALSCGFIDTEMNAAFTEEDKRAFADCLALSRIGTPQEVADVAYFLCSDESSYVTGQILGVDGGF